MLNYILKYPLQIAPVSASFPYGEAQNITIPDDGTGTPWDYELINDILGFFQKMVTEASIVPSGVSETVLASDIYDALDSFLTEIDDKYLPNNVEKLLTNNTDVSPGDANIGKGYKGDQYYGNLSEGILFIARRAVGDQFYSRQATGGAYFGLLAEGIIEIGSTAGSAATKKLISGSKNATFEEIIDSAIEGAWQTPTLINGWAFSTNPLRFRLSHNGKYLYIFGAVTGSSATSTDAFVLPVGWRPSGISTVFYSTGAFRPSSADGVIGIGITSAGGVRILLQSNINNYPTGLTHINTRIEMVVPT